MSALDRPALEASPLADLHMIASELGLDGFRRLRKADLIDAIVERSGGEPAAPAEADADSDGADSAPRREPRSRGGRRRGPRAGSAAASEDDGKASRSAGTDSDEESSEPARGRGARRGRGRGGAAAGEDDGPERTISGVVEVLGNGSGFVRVSPPEPSDDDVYVSAAQIRRCELVSGDEVTGPVRPPRRSERYSSLVRVETINGSSADEVAEGTRFDDLPAALPAERVALGVEDPTVKAIEWLTPFGKGSRVTIVGAARAGKTEALRRLARALASQEGLELSVVLAGVRPEEIGEWAADLPEPAAALSFAASPDAQAQALERALDAAKRVAARGGDSVVIVDTLAYLPPAAARKALAAARNVADGGSLTVIATAPEPLGGETTVIGLDLELTSTGRFPALDLLASGTLRPDLLVGEAGAEAIAKARSSALDRATAACRPPGPRRARGRARSALRRDRAARRRRRRGPRRRPRRAPSP
jgi:transcription termination factor Rho